MNSDPINEIHTSQQFKKYWTKKLKDLLDQENQSIGSNKSEHPTVTLAMTFHKYAGGGGGGYLCPVYMRPIDNFLTELGKSFSINECWSNECKTIGQQSMMQRWKIKLQRTILVE